VIEIPRDAFATLVWPGLRRFPPSALNAVSTAKIELWYNWLVPLFRAFVTSASMATVWHPIRNLFITSNVGFVSRLPEWRWADKTWWRAIVKRTYKYTGWTLQLTQVNFSFSFLLNGLAVSLWVKQKLRSFVVWSFPIQGRVYSSTFYLATFFLRVECGIPSSSTGSCERAHAQWTTYRCLLRSGGFWCKLSG